MSKLSEMIRASQTNERRAVIEPLMSFRSYVEEVSEPFTRPEYYVYRLTAEFGCNATIKHGDSKALDSQLKIVRRQVVESLFGEFREDIYAIQRALIEFDTNKAQELVSNLDARMFDV